MTTVVDGGALAPPAQCDYILSWKNSVVPNGVAIMFRCECDNDILYWKQKVTGDTSLSGLDGLSETAN